VGRAVSALKFKTLYSSGTLLPMYQSTRRHIPEDRDLHFHLRENLESQRECVSGFCSKCAMT